MTSATQLFFVDLHRADDPEINPDRDALDLLVRHLVRNHVRMLSTLICILLVMLLSTGLVLRWLKDHKILNRSEDKGDQCTDAEAGAVLT